MARVRGKQGKVIEQVQQFTYPTKVILRQSVLRVAGLNSAASRLGNTAWKKRRYGGELLATLCPI